jgi:glycosyltransferase involved in cell wall biosynthesis
VNPPPQQPLRVLHIMLEAAWGGLSRYVIDLANAMAPLGVQSFAAADDGEWRSRFDGANLRFVQIPLMKERFLFRESRRMIESALRDHSIDLIHTHYRKATILARKLRVARYKNPGLKAPACLPILYTVHLSHMNMSGLRRWFTDFGDYTHIASEDARDWCINVGKVKPDRIRYVPHGIDVEKFPIADDAAKARARRALQLDDSDLVAAFVGRLEYPKNEHWLLDLAAASKGALPNLKILLAGNGPNASRLRDRIDSENLHDRVRLLGEIDPLPLYHAADALLLPSIREGFSLVCAEAMSCGVPVLRTRTTGSKETIIENITGRTTDIDHDAFLRGAIDFLSNRDHLKIMGTAAAQHIRANHTHALQVQRMMELYRSIAGREASGD